MSDDRVTYFSGESRSDLHCIEQILLGKCYIIGNFLDLLGRLFDIALDQFFLRRNFLQIFEICIENGVDMELQIREKCSHSKENWEIPICGCCWPQTINQIYVFFEETHKNSEKVYDILSKCTIFQKTPRQAFDYVIEYIDKLEKKEIKANEEMRDYVFNKLSEVTPPLFNQSKMSFPIDETCSFISASMQEYKDRGGKIVKFRERGCHRP